MLKTALIVSLCLVATSAQAAAPSPSKPSPGEIERAERAFAADGLALGVRDSFLKHMADDAIMFRPGLVSAKALYESRPSSKAVLLEWWPQKVVIARSGDLGLSVGPSAVDGKRGGYYATIWRKQPDGQWKWIYDGGAEAPARPRRSDPQTPAIQGPTATLGSKSPAEALAAVRDAEHRLARAATDDAPKAYPRRPGLGRLADRPGRDRRARPARTSPAGSPCAPPRMTVRMDDGGSWRPATSSGPTERPVGPAALTPRSTRTICMSGKGAPKAGA